MGNERRVWIGNVFIAAVMFVVAVLPIAKTTASWILGILAVFILVGFVLLFPWPTASGQGRRLVGGRQVAGSQVAGDNAKQYMANRDLTIDGGIDNQ